MHQDGYQPFFKIPKGNLLMHPSKSFRFLRQGKVRDVYASGDSEHLLIVASDRISAFDYVLPNTITDKGKILTSLSNFWFERTGHIIANHIVSTQPSFEHWEDDERWSLGPTGRPIRTGEESRSAAD